MPTPTDLTPEQALARGRIEEVRAQLKALAVALPESRAGLRAERKKIYAALDDLLQIMGAQVAYENLISPATATDLVKQVTRRLKL